MAKTTRKKVTKKKATKRTPTKPAAKRKGGSVMKHYESFDLWAAAQAPEFKNAIAALRRFVKTTAPELKESVKWGNGVWVTPEWPRIFLYGGADDHLQFGFFNGSKLKDPKALLQGSGAWVRHIKIYSSKDIDKPAFKKLIQQSVKTKAGK